MGKIETIQKEISQLGDDISLKDPLALTARGIIFGIKFKQTLDDKTVEQIKSKIKEVKRILNKSDINYPILLENLIQIEKINKEYQKIRQETQKQMQGFNLDILFQHFGNNNPLILTTKGLLEKIDFKKLNNEQKEKVLGIYKRIKVETNIEKILTLAMDAKNIYDGYISGEKDNKRKKEKQEKKIEKIEKNSEIISLLKDIKDIEIDGKIDIDTIQNIIKALKRKLEDKDLSSDEKDVIKGVIVKFEEFLNSGGNKIKSDLSKINNKFDTIAEEIANTSFPSTISIFGSEIEFQTKEQALRFIKSLKRRIQLEVDSIFEIISDSSLKLLKEVGWGGIKSIINLELLFSHLSLLNQKDDIKDHFSDDEYGWLALDLAVMPLGLLIFANLNSLFTLALLESGGRLIQDTTGRLGVNLYEDYSSEQRIELMSVEGEKNENMAEYFQREDIIRGLELSIENIQDKKLKNKLLKNIEELKQFKRIKTNTFYFKAYLIGERIGLKNFSSFKYLTTRLKSLVTGTKFVFPDFKNQEYKEKGIKKLYKKLFLKTYWQISLESTLMPQINEVVFKSKEKLKQGAETIFKEVNVDIKDGIVQYEILDDADGKYIKMAKEYLRGLSGITEEEREYKLELIDDYKESAKKNIGIGEQRVRKDIYKIVKLGLINQSRFKDIIKEEFVLLIDENIEFERLLDGKDNFKMLKQQSRIPGQKGKKILLYKLITLFNNGKIAISEKKLREIIKGIKDGTIKEIKPLKVEIKVDDINKIFEKGKRLKKEFEKGKEILNQKGGVSENLSHIIDLDSKRFPDEIDLDEKNKRKNLEEIYEKIFNNLKIKVKNGEIYRTGKQAKLDIVKLYSGYLPNFAIVDIITGAKTYGLIITGLNIEQENVKDFLDKVEKGLWTGDIKYLLKVIIPKLKNGETIKENIITFNVESEIQDINREGQKLYEKSFKNEKYDLPFNEEGKLNIQDIKRVELNLAELYHSISGEQFNSNKLTQLIAKINKGTDYLIEEYFIELKDALDVDIKLEEGMNRDMFNKRIALLNKKKLDILIASYEAVEDIKEKSRIIREIKNILGISSEQGHSNVIHAMEEVGVNLRYILDKIRDFEENSRLEKEKQKIQQQEQNRIEQERLQRLEDAISFLEKYTVNPKSKEEYNKVKDKLESKLGEGILPLYYEIIRIDGEGEIIALNRVIEKAIQEKLIELYIHRYGGIDKIPTDILKKHKFLQDSVLEAIIDTNLLKDISTELKQEIRGLKENQKIEVIRFVKEAKEKGKITEIEIEKKVRDIKPKY